MPVAPNHLLARRKIHFNGYKTSVSNTAFVVLGEGLPTLPPTGGEQIEALGGAADTLAGTGAQVITVVGLDSAGVVQSETINLNGATAVASARTDWRAILDAWVSQAGSGGVNAADITIRKSPALATRFTIVLGKNRGASGMYTVPEGYTLSLSTVSVTHGSGNICIETQVEANINPLDGSWNPSIFYPLATFRSRNENTLWLNPDPTERDPQDARFVIPEFATVRLLCKADAVTSNPTSAYCTGVLRSKSWAS